MDGIDFSGSMTRRQFEQMAEKLFQDVTTPIKRFLFDHDLKPSELTAV
jgi:molecular chaperone DnaK (HSP70)